MKIAITGGIASGKSALLKMLRERGASTASADAIARDVLWNPDVQAQLMRHFQVADEITPVLLRTLIAQGDDERRAINKIMHPHISSALDASTAQFIEVPLLFETCLHVGFDAIWVAFCRPETQSKRVIERYGSQSSFDAQLWQLDSKVALSFADSVISTEPSLESTQATLFAEAKRWRVPLVVS